MTTPVTGPALTGAGPGAGRGPTRPVRTFPTGFLGSAATDDAKRFGVVGVDVGMLERTPKRSALVYGEVARSGCLPGSDTVGP